MLIVSSPNLNIVHAREVPERTRLARLDGLPDELVSLILENARISDLKSLLLVNRDISRLVDLPLIATTISQTSLKELNALKNGKQKSIMSQVKQIMVESGTSPLQKLFDVACVLGRIRDVESMIAHKDVDPAHSSNYPMRLAATVGQARVVELLLKDPRVDPSAMNSRALRLAASEGHNDVVKILLKDERTDATAENFEAIAAAAKSGYLDIVKTLLQDPSFKHANDEIKSQLVFLAVSKNSPDLLQALIDYNNHHTYKISFSDRENLAIRMACAQNSEEIVKMLLELPLVDSTSVDSECLRVAARNGNIELVHLLTQQKGANPQAQHNEALRVAAAKGYYAIVDILLRDKRVSPGDLHDETLRGAVRANQTEIVHLLLSDDRVNPTVNRYEPIGIALQMSNPDIVELLLRNKHVTHSAGAVELYQDVFQVAVQRNWVDIVKFLLTELPQGSVNPAAKDNLAMRMTGFYGYAEIMELLLKDKRADPTAHRNEALRQAVHRYHYEVVRLLLEDFRVRPGIGLIHSMILRGYTDAAKILFRAGHTFPLPQTTYYILSCIAQNGSTELRDVFLEEMAKRNGLTMSRWIIHASFGKMENKQEIEFIKASKMFQKSVVRRPPAVYPNGLNKRKPGDELRGDREQRRFKTPDY